MSKNLKLTVGSIHSLLPHQIWWDMESNSRGDVPDDVKDLDARIAYWHGDREDRAWIAESLADKGWLTTEGVVHATISTEEEVDKCLVFRQQYLDYLIRLSEADSKDADIDDRIVAYKAMYFDDNGEPLSPLVTANMMFRRGFTLADAGVKLLKGDGESRPSVDAEDISGRLAVPVEIFEYANELDRLVDQAQENTLKGKGAVKYSPRALLTLAVKAVKEGATQARLRGMFKDGTGQKLWSVIEADRLYPQVHLISRLYAGEDETAREADAASAEKRKSRPLAYRPGGPIPLSAVRPGPLVKFVGKSKDNTYEYSPSGLENLIRTEVFKLGGKETAKLGSLKEIQNLHDKANVIIAADAFASTYSDDKLRDFNRHVSMPGAEEAYNVLYALVNEGRGQEAAAALQALFTAEAESAEAEAEAEAEAKPSRKGRKAKV